MACIRDQIYLTIDCYKRLYESSIAFGIRKAVFSEKRKIELKEGISKLSNECIQLKKEVNNLEQKIDKTRSQQEELQRVSYFKWRELASSS